MFLTLLLAMAAPPLEAAPQDAPPAKPQTAADGTQRWSILADPCAADRSRGEEIVVCGPATQLSPRLPLPAERGAPDRPMPSNPDRTGIGALNATNSPCATRSQGCTTGVNIFGGATALVRTIGKIADPDSCCERPGEATNPFMLVGDAVSGIKRGFRKKPDKSNRVPIPLDDLPAPKPEASGTPAP